MPEISKQQEESYRLTLLNADIAAQTSQGDRALKILAELKVEDLPPGLQAGYYGITGEAYVRLRKYNRARWYILKALKIYRQPEVDTASPLQIAQLRNFLALTYYQQNEFQKALEIHTECLQAVISGYVTEQRFKLKLYNNLGNENLFLGFLKPSLYYFQEVLKLAVPGEDDLDLGTAYWGMGITYRQLDDYKAAVRCLTKALKLYRKGGAVYYLPDLRNTLGWVLISQGNYDRAEKELKTGLAEAVKAKTIHFQPPLNLNLAYLYLKKEMPEVAEGYALTAVELARQGRDKYNIGMTLAQLAEIRLACSVPFEEVRPLFEEALANIRQTDSIEFTRRVFRRYALALNNAGFVEEAFDMLNRAFDLFEKG